MAFRLKFFLESRKIDFGFKRRGAKESDGLSVFAHSVDIRCRGLHFVIGPLFEREVLATRREAKGNDKIRLLFPDGVHEEFPASLIANWKNQGNDAVSL